MMILPAITTTMIVAKLLKPADKEEPKPVMLAVLVAEQERTQWCWVAVGLAIVQAYGTAPGRTQCEHATRVLGRHCCPYGIDCNKALELPPSLCPHFHSFDEAPDHRVPDFVRTEIDGGRPIAVRIDWRTPGSGHYVVISGYQDTQEGMVLHVWDPQDGGRAPVPFETFKDSYRQEGFWHRSYLTTGTPVKKEGTDAAGA